MKNGDSSQNWHLSGFTQQLSTQFPDILWFFPYNNMNFLWISDENKSPMSVNPWPYKRFFLKKI